MNVYLLHLDNILGDLLMTNGDERVMMYDATVMAYMLSRFSMALLLGIQARTVRKRAHMGRQHINGKCSFDCSFNGIQTNMYDIEHFCWSESCIID